MVGPRSGELNAMR